MDLNSENFTYLLPEEKIARYPLKIRHHSKLLVYHGGKIHHTTFLNIDQFLSPDSLMVFNNTRVVQARIKFRKKTGAVIEIFCFEPEQNQEDIEKLMMLKKGVRWKCLIGNRKRWKDNEVLEKSMIYKGKEIVLKASYAGVQQDVFLIDFVWGTELSFAEILEIFGETPLPPYLKREAEQEDKATYQTVYAEKHGAVAAPTAGLHFTDEVFKRLESRGIDRDFVTLHVSGGTFQPIKTDHPADHPMHTEQISVSYSLVEKLLNHQGKIISVGTTTLRTLESLYWFGVMLESNPESNFFIPRLFPYSNEFSPTELRKSLRNVLGYMDKKNINTLHGSTEIIIFPGYQFHFGDGLVTNFHQPRSTLLLLIAAFIGNNWKTIYQTALENDYRFLSYGDAMLLMR